MRIVIILRAQKTISLVLSNADLNTSPTVEFDNSVKLPIQVMDSLVPPCM